MIQKKGDIRDDGSRRARTSSGMARQALGTHMPDFPETKTRIAGSATASRWRGTAFLRFGSFLSMWGVVHLCLLAGAGWGMLPAALAASALTGALGLGALYSPLIAGLTARRSAVTGQLSAVPGRGASWTGGVVVALGMGMMAGGAAWFAAGEGVAVALLPALALGLNASYLPAKAACLFQGCCRARQAAAPGLLRRWPGELPGLEISLTLVTLVACLLVRDASPGAIAAAGFLGHGLTRLVSIRFRGHLRTVRPLFSDPGAELPALCLAALISLTVI
jgi:hypothetical protein